MCGIIGIASCKHINDRSWLIAGRDAMTHRGPDDTGEWWSPEGQVGLGHCRLAIIDVSPTGHQPMQDISGRYVVVYNGEIYNYRELQKQLLYCGHVFRSASDTEVLLEAYKQWGINCLDHLVGAFAFAIYDSVEKLFFLARDRAGEKPLFYWHGKDGFYFASELKALMAVPSFDRKLDLEALDHYFTYGYVAGSKSLIKGVQKLLPSHAMLYSAKSDSCRIWRYWSIPDPYAEQTAATEELVDHLELLLSKAVKQQLVADVPIGVLLSGGLDSSLITAFAAMKSDKKVKTFTVSFPGHSAHDEGPYAKIVAEHFGTDHTELVAEPASVSLLPQLARQYDEPIADHSIVPTSMLARLVRGTVTVALGGDGGDELFGGYPHYNFLQKTACLRRLIPSAMRNAGAFAASRFLPVGTKGRNHIIGMKNGPGASISAVDVFFDEVTRKRLLAPLFSSGYRPEFSPELAKQRFFNPALSIFQNAARTDFQSTMVDDYLVKSDRASMLHSLELRAPFLDHTLIEFAFGQLPDHLRASATGRKVLLKMLAKRLLPSDLDINRKQGFTLPIGAWFKGEWGEFMKVVLMEADRYIFDRKTIVRLLDGQKKGRSNADRLFAITMFELWRREYRVAL